MRYSHATSYGFFGFELYMGANAAFLITTSVVYLDFTDGKKKMNRVITFGTFDVLHIGHIRLLKRARTFGSHLIVGLSSDELNISKKGRAPVYSLQIVVSKYSPLFDLSTRCL